MKAVTVRAPGKVHLHLSVGSLRADGFHDVTGLYHAVSVFDDVTVTAAERLELSVAGDPGIAIGDVPVGDGNLAVRAVRVLASAVGRQAQVAIRIRKSIPVAAGMAGGSANAAAALVACNELWSTGLTTSDLSSLAAGLGSDVPFALFGGTALGVNRGEQLTPVVAGEAFHWVLAINAAQLSAAVVCDRLDRLRSSQRAAIPGPRPPAPELLAALAMGDAPAVGAAMHNDLQPAAIELEPSLVEILALGRSLGALGSIVSGSGPTCAFPVESRAHADELITEFNRARICRSARYARSSAEGATVYPYR